MNAEEIREIIKRREEMWNTGNLDIAHDLFAEDIISHEGDGDHRGIEDFKDKRRGLANALPDLQMEYSQIVTGEDQAAYVWTITGTHEGVFDGPLGPVEPTGEKVVLRGGLNSRFENGKIVEEWVHLDRMQFLEQMAGIDFDALFQRLRDGQSEQEHKERGNGGQRPQPSM